jgi:hypothetical protein
MAIENKKSLILKLWHDPVWSKVIATAIVVGAAAIWASFAGLWPSIGAVPANIWDWMGKKTPVSNWVTVLLSLGAFAFVVGVAVVARAVIIARMNIQDLQSYSRDEFFGIRWRWRISDDGQIYDLHSFCPACDYQVYGVNSSAYIVVPQTTYRCEECGRNLYVFNGTDEELESRVRRKIQQKLRDLQRQGCTADSD